MKKFLELIKTRTFWSMVVMAVAFIMQMFGKTINVEQQDVLVNEALNIVSGVLAIIGAFGVSYGRLNAKKIITRVNSFNDVKFIDRGQK